MSTEQINSNPDNCLTGSFTDGHEDVSGKLISLIGQFTTTWLGYKPHSINATFHNGGISVTMTGILSEAEKNVSGNTALSELIVKNHTGAFKTVRKVLEKQLGEVLRKSIVGSSLLLDPESNCATILLQV